MPPPQTCVPGMPTLSSLELCMGSSPNMLPSLKPRQRTSSQAENSNPSFKNILMPAFLQL